MTSWMLCWWTPLCCSTHSLCLRLLGLGQGSQASSGKAGQQAAKERAWPRPLSLQLGVLMRQAQAAAEQGVQHL